MTELEKIDQLRKRLGLSYREAKEALDRAGGDLLEALIQYEEGVKEETQSALGNWGSKLIERIRNILHQGNVTRIKVKKDGKTVAEIPATAGALGILGVLASSELAVLAGLSTVAALFNRYTLEVERPDGRVEEHSLAPDEQVDK
ncbi:MAG: hypothetical protein PWP41_415 [Moorella sp. (in: firmicutes)]|uniref:DUF4342 domain-containing protein n=1 Tax=Neomoorella thermoacetica TaxID=1525 RepID=A0A1J5NTN5_NEOTH|nr:hypothetical protein [Moorella sp. (in: firmicutes)]OIQ61576.1 hypothetical protein MOTE_01460 [Moorella thermoacetica]